MRSALFGIGIALAAVGCTSMPGNAQGSANAGEEPGTTPPAVLQVVTLGTAGGPPPHVGRAQPATALQIGDRTYLIDAGEGAGHQLHQAGVRPLGLNAVFITHLHWDHTLGLDYIMATEWMRNRRAQLPLIGPKGLDLLVSRQVASVQVGEDIFRVQAPYRPALSSLYPVQEVPSCSPAEVFRDDAVRVTAVCNSHFSTERAPPHSYGEDTALSYRFDTALGSVTFTGDTGPSSELEALASGSDVLVAEVVDVPSIERAIQAASPGMDTAPMMVHMTHQHLTAQEIGQLAARAGVRKVVLTHYVIGAGFDIDTLVDQVKEHFSGEVVAARDLQVFAVPAQ